MNCRASASPTKSRLSEKRQGEDLRARRIGLILFRGAPGGRCPTLHNASASRKDTVCESSSCSSYASRRASPTSSFTLPKVQVLAPRSLDPSVRFNLGERSRCKTVCLVLMGPARRSSIRQAHGLVDRRRPYGI